MALKLYIHWEESGFPEKTSKIQIPKSWLKKTVKDVIGLFATPYNNTNKDTLIEVDDVHLETPEGVKIYSNDIVGDCLEDRYDYHIKPGSHLKPTAIAEEDVTLKENRLRCKNYGCNQYYLEEENTDTSCQHHTGPPIFHDTMKCWSCCKDQKKAYDFETFQLIAGCATGRHSQVAQGISIAASPNNPDGTVAPAAATATALPTPPPALKSISDYNASNPDAATAASSAVKVFQAERKSSRNADGVTAKCQRKGCQKTFNISENNASACTYHKGNPVFHDAVKFWSCCDQKKCYDFEEFLAVPGCATGSHDDGVIDL